MKAQTLSRLLVRILVAAAAIVLVVSSVSLIVMAALAFIQDQKLDLW